MATPAKIPVGLTMIGIRKLELTSASAGGVSIYMPRWRGVDVDVTTAENVNRRNYICHSHCRRHGRVTQLYCVDNMINIDSKK